ncbi:Fructoselysine-6-P-deglycase FrlB with duplicated sugar isomerase (SIS) domain [Paramicrobacterium humi]|uniref:Fructoselysine-6-P-deglycase FrlB with duplicated sugar isomerase (SIS) domain n=1 Tax=Paramicrobacterium humi TaxID=640635 RepID=A0A1H4IVF5_9MICO|nr:sugar isomerase [Microbacterium humi]SEB38003.1 Fructoselysine-6-P-deglycase FrlB with duplicated sugar isomerase (SIS) domain [Microbacterium humi]
MSQPGAYMATELASQPDVWSRAIAQGDEGKLPPAGARIAVVGCGTSWFMAQSYAALRESAGLGITDAFAASEAFIDRDYDAVVALTRSGTTTEVLELLEHLGGSTRTVAVIGDTATPIVDMVDQVIAFPYADETSVVQTRFATTALTFFRHSTGADVSQQIADAHAVLAEELPAELVQAEQFSFLGRGWTTGLAHEAALKMREASQSWTESYSAMEYRHGPIAIAAPGRVTWMFGEAPEGLAGQVGAAGAHFENAKIDPLADLVRAQRVALQRALDAGLDPDTPRNLTRSVILDA